MKDIYEHQYSALFDAVCRDGNQTHWHRGPHQWCDGCGRCDNCGNFAPLGSMFGDLGYIASRSPVGSTEPDLGKQP